MITNSFNNRSPAKNNPNWNNDAPEWTQRIEKWQIKRTQHDAGHFEIALALAEYAAKL